MISAIIPTLNEALTIGEVVSKCKKFCDEVIVVDGNSKDQTREVAEKYGAIVYLKEGKSGKGSAMRFGVEMAKGDILIFIDGDGSHEPNDIPKITSQIIYGNVDMVITSRGKGGSDELHGNIEKLIRLIGSSIITLLINMKFKTELTDSQNGFRGIRKTAFHELELRENSFSIEQEMLIKCLKKGKRVIEIASHEYARKYGKSRINLWKMWPRYLWTLLKGIY